MKRQPGGTTRQVLSLPHNKARALEIGFATVFSAVILVVFYSLISMNGLVLGNDPAVHLERAQIFLQTGQIPLANIGWTPPLYQILLAALISFTGVTSLEQMIFLVKAVAVVIDWLLFFSVYLIGAKFFGRRVGAVASVLLLMCFPVYEINLWGGYTSVLGISFVVLLLLYLPSSVKSFGHLLVTFVAAFSVVLSHQLAAFITVLILVPVFLVMLKKSRGTYLKALVALGLGGGAAFVLYYWQAIFPYLGGLIAHVFWEQRAMLYQVPATTLNAFMVNFGFIFVVALLGAYVAFFNFRRQRNLTLYLILFLSFLVPFVLAESYVMGLLLPFQWFIYYLMPPLVVFAAAFLVFALGKVSGFYLRYSRSWRRVKLRAVAVVLTVLVASLFLFRFGVVYGKIDEASVYYSTSDIKGYDAGLWLRDNYPGEATVVVTEVPGFWFRVFSGKTVIAATDPIIERNAVSESVLYLSYELEHPQTLIRALEAKGEFSDETSVSINAVWNKVSYSHDGGHFISYRANGIDKYVQLSNLTRETSFEGTSQPRIVIRYVNEEIAIAKTVTFQNDSYPINIEWNLSALQDGLSNVSLYVTVNFYLDFWFEKAYLPGILDWENPWDKPSTSSDPNWTTIEFSPSTLNGNCIGLYDEKKLITFALEFNEVPEWGNIGALTSRQVDAIRFQHNITKINKGEDVSFAYRILAFSKSSLPTVQMPSDVETLFSTKVPAGVVVLSRDYKDYVRDNDVQFIVYDKNDLDTNMIHSEFLQLVYSNDRYVIFKIKDT